MRYDSPELRAVLAAEYFLGTMPRLARRRLERLMAADPELARLVANWADRFAPLDDATPVEEPPARVWRATEGRIGGAFAAPPTVQPALPWHRTIAFWRSLAIVAGAAAAGLALYIAVYAGRVPAPTVVAVLSGHGGASGWVAVTGPKSGDVSFSAVAPPSEPKPHAFELWSIAHGRPRPLGLLPQSSGSAMTLRLGQLPPPSGVLAVSLEPPGGSPTGLPTGPVLYQGRVLTR